MQVWLELFSSNQTCIPDGHAHRVLYTRYRIDTVDSPDDEHMAARNICRELKETYTKIVRQICYLQGLYQDVRSTKPKIMLVYNFLKKVYGEE